MSILRLMAEGWAADLPTSGESELRLALPNIAPYKGVVMSVSEWRQRMDNEERKINKLHRRLYGDGELSPEAVVDAINYWKYRRHRFVIELFNASEGSGIPPSKLLRELELKPTSPIDGENKLGILTDACFLLNQKGYRLPGTLRKPILYFEGIGLTTSVLEAARRRMPKDIVLSVTQKLETIEQDQST